MIKKPCSVCRRWFVADPRVGKRQRTCGGACREKQRQRTQAEWRARNPTYWTELRLGERVEQLRKRSGGPPADGSTDGSDGTGDGGDARVAARGPTRPPPQEMAKVPWDMAQDAFGAQGVVLIAFLLRLTLRGVQDAMRTHVTELKGDST